MEMNATRGDWAVLAARWCCTPVAARRSLSSLGAIARGHQAQGFIRAIPCVTQGRRGADTAAVARRWERDQGRGGQRLAASPRRANGKPTQRYGVASGRRKCAANPPGCACHSPKNGRSVPRLRAGTSESGECGRKVPSVRSWRELSESAVGSRATGPRQEELGRCAVHLVTMGPLALASGLRPGGGSSRPTNQWFHGIVCVRRVGSSPWRGDLWPKSEHRRMEDCGGQASRNRARAGRAYRRLQRSAQRSWLSTRLGTAGLDCAAGSWQ